MNLLPSFKKKGPSLSKHIALMGMPGVGKSSIGRKLAEQINIPFIDVDHYIEQHTKKTIPLIFAEDGESTFREIEQQVVERLLLSPEKSIISLGGGSVLHPKTRELLKKHSFTVWLRIDLPLLIERLKKSKTIRPLLSHNNLETYVERLHLQRMPFYADADCIVDNGHISKYTATRRIIISLQNLP